MKHELIVVPGQGHGFDRSMQDPAIAKAFDAVLAFLRKRLERQ